MEEEGKALVLYTERLRSVIIENRGLQYRRRNTVVQHISTAIRNFMTAKQICIGPMDLAALKLDQDLAENIRDNDYTVYLGDNVSKIKLAMSLLTVGGFWLAGGLAVNDYLPKHPMRRVMVHGAAITAAALLPIPRRAEGENQSGAEVAVPMKEKQD